jgi:membrane associated rhomboid family serine protease
MGIYDRDYYRQQRPQPRLRGPRTVVGMLILINVAFFLANGLFTPPETGPGLRAPSSMEEVLEQGMGWLTYHMAVKVSTLTHPWRWWQFLTYGFAHAPPPDYWHIAGNMLVLFFLGRDIEARYGSKEFLRLYLAMLVVASVAWASVEAIKGVDPAVPAVGASGAVAGVVVLYALNFPHRTLLLFFVIPMPAWVAGLLVVLMDVFGALTGAAHIAFTAHLGGAAFAFFYHQGRWNLTRWSGWFSLDWLKSRPNLRVHDPDQGNQEKQELSDEVDRILEKISAEGEQSLTWKERRTLETASRQYQKKRRDTDDGP